MIQGRDTAVLKKASKSELMSEIIDAQLRETERYGGARAISNDRAVSGNTVPEFDAQLILGLQQYKDETIWYFQRRYGFDVLTGKSGGSTPSRSLASRKQVRPSNFCCPHHGDLWM